jgi:hypothetical protein
LTTSFTPIAAKPREEHLLWDYVPTDIQPNGDGLIFGPQWSVAGVLAPLAIVSPQLISRIINGHVSSVAVTAVAKHVS